jgi:hypothetical protein
VRSTLDLTTVAWNDTLGKILIAALLHWWQHCHRANCFTASRSILEEQKHLYSAFVPSLAMLLPHSSLHRALQPLMQQQMKSMRSLLHRGRVSADVIPA